MSQSDVHLFRLPNEILMIILKKLDNMDVLYSLMGTCNERFDILLQSNVFTNTLNLTEKSSTDDDDISSLDRPIIDRFSIDILPKIHQNMKEMILSSISMRDILLAGNYPNLTHLKLFNFEQKIALDYFKGKYLIYS